jgi:hypothetical protein
VTAAITRPAAGEYAPYYGTYIGKVPEGDLLQILENQRRETQSLLGGLSDAKALHRYAPGKWSVKEVVGHIADAERVFAYRALTFARGDHAALPSFDENAWTPAGAFDARPLGELARELEAVRHSTVTLFSGFHPDWLVRTGTASGKSVSVRALAYIIAGHERHHVKILRERYL